MNVALDTSARALYLRLAVGSAADTVELAHSVVADVDERGTPIGIEFVHAEDFGPFLRDHPDVARLPSRLTYAAIDRGKAWDVETPALPAPSTEESAAIAAINGAFVHELLANPSLVDRIPEGATLILVHSGDNNVSTNAVLALAERIAREGGIPVLRPLSIPLPDLPHHVGAVG